MYQEIHIILLISLQITCVKNEGGTPNTIDDGNNTLSTADSLQLTTTTKDSENISTKDDSQETFYHNLELFGNQAGGHSDMWKDKEGFIWKAEGKQNESPFYDSLEKTQDPLLQELRSFIPKYAGTFVQHVEKGTEVWLRIQDITNGFKKPCVMDLKIGKHTFAPNISKRKLFKQLLKYQEMRERWGFSITGFRYHDVETGIFVKRGASFGRSMNSEDAVRVIWEFLNGDQGLKQGLVRVILEQLRKLDSWFERQRLYKFFGSSILIAYDATYLAESAEPIVSVRMIDFTQTVPITDGFRDDNYMYGLEKLIALLEELNSEGCKYSVVSDKSSKMNINNSSILPEEKYKLFKSAEYIIETTISERLQQIDQTSKEEQKGGKNMEDSSNIASVEFSATCDENLINDREIIGSILKRFSGTVEEKILQSMRAIEFNLGHYVFIDKVKIIGFLNLKVGDGLVTPISEPKEIAFYNFLEETKDPNFQKLKKFTLAENGILNVEDEENFLLLQAISTTFHLPCVMQVKIGQKIWDGFYLVEPPKLSHETMRNRLAFNIEGFYFFNMTKKILEKCESIKCRNLDPTQGVQAIDDFVNGKIGMQSGLVDSILHQLKEIEFWFKQQSTSHFYNSSILIAYDALDLERGTFPLVNPVPKVRVRMADFANVLRNSEKTKDKHYIKGLKELIAVIRNLDIKKAEVESNADQLKKEKRTQS